MVNAPTTSDDSSSATARRGVLKSAAVITALTFLSRILGLVREQVRGYYLGTGMSSDAFGLAATIPNLFRRLLAEGAMTAAFVPVFTGYLKKDNRQELLRFFSSFITLLTFVTTLVCVAGILLAEVVVETFFGRFSEVPDKLALTVTLTQIMFPYLLFVTLAAIVQAVLNTFRVFAPSAFTPVLLNLLIVLSAVSLHSFFPDPAYAFAAGFLAGGVCQLLFQLPWFFRLGMRLGLSFNWGHPGVRELGRIFVPGAFAAGIYQINVFVSQMIAASLDQGSISALQFSNRLQELVLGVFVVSITTVILPTLAGQHAKGDRGAFGDTNMMALDLMAFLTVPASVALLLLRGPLVSLLFEQGAFDQQSTAMTTYAVLFHSMGIYFIASSRSLNQAFYAMKDLRTPMFVAGIAMLVNIGGCYLLSIPLAHGGIALANSLSAMVTAVLLFGLLVRRSVQLQVRSHLWLLARVLVCSGIMAGALYVVQLYLPGAPDRGKLALMGLLGLYVAAGVAAFGAASFLFTRKEVLQLLRLVRKGART